VSGPTATPVPASELAAGSTDLPVPSTSRPAQETPSLLTSLPSRTALSEDSDEDERAAHDNREPVSVTLAAPRTATTGSAVVASTALPDSTGRLAVRETVEPNVMVTLASGQSPAIDAVPDASVAIGNPFTNEDALALSSWPVVSSGRAVSSAADMATAAPHEMSGLDLKPYLTPKSIYAGLGNGIVRLPTPSSPVQHLPSGVPAGIPPVGAPGMPLASSFISHLTTGDHGTHFAAVLVALSSAVFLTTWRALLRQSLSIPAGLVPSSPAPPG
jgi:hypothetical protein